MIMNDPKGSIWRKWDLHFHTHSSYDYEDNSITNQDIIDILKSNNISVVAITDHHIIDIQRIKELNELAKRDIVILPGIEMRSELGGSESIHFIGIFPEDSEDYNIETTWTKLQGQLNLTSEDIKNMGDNNIYCDLKEASNLIHELGGIVSIHAGRKSNTIENITNSLPYKQAIKRDVLDFIDIFEMGQLKNVEEYEQKVFPKINKHPPMIICSDNHNIKKYKLRDNCWIKADPTFEGLKQILNEPKERVFIGETPPILGRVHNNKTKYIKSVFINKKEDSGLDEIWFTDIKIDLNPELVAIIGNKGNGKSALTDIIGLVGNTHNHRNFSFLNEEKFRQPKNNKASHFEGELQWESEDIDKDKRGLDQEDTEPHEYEKVKYVPQKFLEVLCNEEKEDFEKELKKIIFSHVPEEQRLGQNSLDKLVTFKTEAVNKGIDMLCDRLSATNKEIIELEEMSTDKYRQEIEERLKIKNQELQAHEKIKPNQVKQPESDDINPELKKISEEINIKTKKKRELEEIRDENRKKKTEIHKKVASIDRVSGEIENFKTQYEYLKTELENDLSILGFSFDDIVSLETKIEPLNKKKGNLKSELKGIEDDLNPQGRHDIETETFKDNTYTELERITKEIEELQNRLDEPNKKYQRYLKQLSEWESKEKEIIGSKDKEDSIGYYEKRLDYIRGQLSEDLKEKREERSRQAREIYKKKEKLIEIYKELYEPVKKFVDEHRLSKPNNQVKFDVSFEVVKDFKKTFFSFVHQGVKGSFQGTEEGTKRLQSILDSIDFNNENSVIEFLCKIIDNLERDHRDNGSEEKKIIREELKKDINVLDFYGFLFSLEYLAPTYKLKFGDKELPQLSPGEKGALLLIFYLLIDNKDNIPLIIDQPEENLDNQSVYELLVPYIKEAKKRRQIIIVTHNPNLAVVCDAEQIIYAKIDKSNKNKVTYESGAIENPEINKRIVEVLEGTLPAFNNRDAKYTITKTIRKTMV